MKAALAIGGGLVVAGAIAATAVATGVVDIPPLVADDEVALEPLVPEEDGDEVPLEPLVPSGDPDDPLEPEPLIPAGTELAEAYRIEVRHAYTAAHDAAIAADRQDGDEWYSGDIVRVAEDRYEGELVAVASLEQRVTGMMDYSCTITWVGRQVVRAVGIVRTADSLPPSMIQGDDAGGVYLPLYIPEPVGPVEWSDPDDDCGGVTSEWLPISWTDPSSGSALGGAVPRLPPPGFGKIEERFDYDGPGILGPTTYEWVFTLTPISAAEVRSADVLLGDALEIPPLVGD